MSDQNSSKGKYGEYESEKLRQIARSGDYSDEARDAAIQVLKDRGEETAGLMPQPRQAPGGGGPRGFPVVKVVVLLALALSVGLFVLRQVRKARIEAAQEEAEKLEFGDQIAPPSSFGGEAKAGDEARPEGQAAASKDSTAAGAPTAASRPRAVATPPVREVPWKPPARPANKLHKAVLGTWVARVDPRATRTAFMDARVGLMLGKGKKGSIMEILTRGQKLKLNSCIWMEFREGFEGFRSECMIGPKGPSALTGTNPLTGKTTDLGVAFDWYKEGTMVRIRAEKDLVAYRKKEDQLQKLLNPLIFIDSRLSV